MPDHVQADKGSLDPDEIMRRIDAYLTERREAADDTPRQPRTVKGHSGQVHVHLHRALDSADKVRVQVQARPVQLPLVGPWLSRARKALHELTIFYLDQLSSRQIRFNMHISNALAALVDQLDLG